MNNAKHFPAYAFQKASGNSGNNHHALTKEPNCSRIKSQGLKARDGSRGFFEHRMALLRRLEMKRRVLSRDSWVLTSVFVALMLFACGHAVVIGPGPGIPGTPTAIASANPLTGDSPVTVTLSAAGSTDPDGHIVRWQWDFENDGAYDWSSTTTGTVTHEYPAGEYTAKLLVTDDSGKSAVATVKGIISIEPPVYWTFDTLDGGPDSQFYAGNGIRAVEAPDGTMILGYVRRNKTDFSYSYVIATSTDSENWQFDTYDLSRDFDYSTSIGLLPNGTLVIPVRYDAGLSVLWRYPDGIWQLESIDHEDSSNRNAPTLSISSSGKVGIAYRKDPDVVQNWREIRFAEFDGVSWKVSIVPRFDDGAKSVLTSFCYLGDTPVILDSYNKLALYSRPGDSWQEEIIATQLSNHSDNAVINENAGSLYILTSSTSQDIGWSYWENSSGAWIEHSVATYVSGRPASQYCTALNANGSSFFAVVPFYSDPISPVYFCYGSGGSVSREMIGANSIDFSRAGVLFTDDTVFIAYTGPDAVLRTAIRALP